uniref:Uncharacterized protein n=1 Tax=Arundo donax TaxID=35708 RepID=A0A0A9HCB5_ARUDO
MESYPIGRRIRAIKQGRRRFGALQERSKCGACSTTCGTC